MKNIKVTLLFLTSPFFADSSDKLVCMFVLHMPIFIRLEYKILISNFRFSARLKCANK